MHGQAGGGPARVAGDELAEQLHVVVSGAEQALVERLLSGPNRRSERTGKGAVCCAPKLHAARQRNDPTGPG
jgi:hypothetical protein